MQSEIKLNFVKDKKDKTKDCGKCKFFSTNGFLAPSGNCFIHSNFSNNICIDYKCFPKYATICDDYEERK